MKAFEFPQGPFLSEDFSPRGGGIDFLGLRLVNLRILGQDLIPELNNVTGDFGNFCVGAWIPWKFQRVYQRKAFTEENYSKFSEAVEVGMGYCQREGSPASLKFGSPHRKIGVDQNKKLRFPCDLQFETVGRTDATSLYAAPLYGPSIRYLGLLKGFCLGEDGRPTRIPGIGEDQETRDIIEFVDQALSESGKADPFENLKIPKVGAAVIDGLGLRGLHPAFYREAPQRIKRAFLKKLLPPSEGDKHHPRSLTAALLLETIARETNTSIEGIRHVWHTGLLSNKRKFRPNGPCMQRQLTLWGVFLCRQHQRFIIEIFLRCFEHALISGSRSIAETVEFSLSNLRNQCGSSPTTLRELLESEAFALSRSSNLELLSQLWNEQVHGSHKSYDWIGEQQIEKEIGRALTMLCRWMLRIHHWLKEKENLQQLGWGGSERIGMSWFANWVLQRIDQKLGVFLRDLYSELVFSQHLRIALIRSDGRSQKLRFILSDDGIVPTESACSDMAAAPTIMADRLNAFLDLLSDLEVIVKDGDSIAPGRNSAWVNS